MRRSPKVAEVLPILYLRGFRPATSRKVWPRCWGTMRRDSRPRRLRA
jgi:hypothetical protein